MIPDPAGRCDLSDLPVEQCACRVHAKPSELIDAPMLGRPFPASFGGRCPACDVSIHSGDRIQRTADGEYVHEECAP